MIVFRILQRMSFDESAKVEADLTMGISSLPEAIHMTQIKCFAEAVGVYIGRFVKRV